MQGFEIWRPSLDALPPLYRWPMPLKRVVLALAMVTCCAAYLILLVGAIGLVMALLTLQ